MTRALRAANVPQDSLDLIPTAVNDCRGRRKWLPPVRQTTPALRLSAKFDQHAECDSMRYKDRMILHLVCRASRWHDGRRIAPKRASTPLAAID